FSSTSTSNVGHDSSSSTLGSDSARLRFCLRFRPLGGRIVGRIVVGKRWLGLVVGVEKIGENAFVAFSID
ncbi:hypothetical protein Tco_1189438, partial [Tanacetum coccineum]